MYYFQIVPDLITGESVEYILQVQADGGVQSFANVESNTGPERAAYLEWVAEGNTPEPWPPAE